MICPNCKRETDIILTPQYFCIECMVAEQRRKIESLEQIIDNLEAQAVLFDGVDNWDEWAHIPIEEWRANMELWKKYVASRQ